VELLTRQALNLIQNRRRMEIKPLEEEANKKLISPVVMKATDQAFLEKVIKLINENIADNELNVDFLARNIGMSRVHMYRKIKELTNQSAYDFIKTIRMQQASEILSKQKVNISEVAYALGYSNLSHFSNSFKDYYGLSPKEYSEKNRPVNQNNN
jgi:AraC-like DNA-binding protein